MSATVHADRVSGPALSFEEALLSRSVARALSVAVVALAAVMVAGAVVLGALGAAQSGIALKGVSAGGVPLGGMTRAEASAAVSAAWLTYARQPLTLQGPDSAYKTTPAELGLTLDLQATLDRAMAVGHSGSPWVNSQARARGLLRGVSLPLMLDLDTIAAGKVLTEIAPSIVRPSLDASLTVSPGAPVSISPDEPGIAIDSAGTLAEIVNVASMLESAAVPVSVQVLPAAITAADLAPARIAADAALAAPLVIQAADQTWHLPTADLARLLRGRADGTLTVDRPAVVEMVRSIASAIDQPLADASVVVGDNGRLIAVPGGSGNVIDVNASADAIERAVRDASGAVSLAYTTASPMIPNAVATAAAERGNALLDAGLALRWEGGGASLDREDLLRALTISVDPASADPFTFGLDENAIRDTLAGIAGEIDQPMVNARFRLVDGQIAVAVPSKVGRVLDVDAGAQQVVAGFGASQPVTIDVAIQQPVWSDADAALIDLGGDILGEGGTFYGESSEPRRQNVELAALKESGWLVPPGEEFSYAENIGNVDVDAGFVTGFGITEQNGQFATSPVVGGGICQVSTTIFQAAFWAGLPIVERYQHPYFLQSYSGPPTGLPGLDAMVNIDPNWTLDMKFRNTTGDWIAVIVVADGQNLWAKIVGVDPGWNVEVTDPIISDRLTPDSEMVYVDSPELPEGQEMVVEHAADGFKVSLTRTVLNANGEIIDAVTLESEFSPSLNRTLRGTGAPQA